MSAHVDAPTPPAGPPAEDDGAPGAAHTHRRRDAWGSAVTIAVAAYALQRSLSYGLEGTTQVVGPGLFPAIASGALLLLGLVWAVQTWRDRVPAPEELKPWPGREGALRIATTLATLAVAAVLFDLIDFRITVLACVFVILRLVFRRPVVSSLVIGAVISAVCYLGLSMGLDMALPLSF